MKQKFALHWGTAAILILMYAAWIIVAVMDLVLPPRLIAGLAVLGHTCLALLPRLIGHRGSYISITVEAEGTSSNPPPPDQRDTQPPPKP